MRGAPFVTLWGSAMRDDSSSPRQDGDQQKKRLLALVRDGSRQALAELVELYRPFLRAHARRSRGDRLRAKFDTSDIIQNTQLAVLECFAEFRDLKEDELTPQLRTLLQAQIAAATRHYLRVKKRYIGREQPLDGQQSWQRIERMVAASDRGYDDVARRDSLDRIRALMASLSPEHREVIDRFVWQGQSWEAIGEELGCSAAAARMRFNRAAAMLAKQCRREAPGP